MSECNCGTWPNPNPVIKNITGHHESCKQAPKLDEALVMVINDLLKSLIPDLSKTRKENYEFRVNAIDKAEFVIDFYKHKK